MESINNILAMCIVLIGGIIFYIIFRSMIQELIKKKIFSNKDGIFIIIMILLVLIVYIFLEQLHH